MAAQTTAISGSSQLLLSSDVLPYYGFSLRETAGSTAVVRIRDSGVVGGTILDTVAFTANASVREWYGNGGIHVRGGLYVEIVSGTVEGSIRHG